MNIEKNRCIEYFIRQRLLLDEKILLEMKKKELVNNIQENNDVQINMEKYNNFIVLGVVIYMVLTFTLVR